MRRCNVLLLVVTSLLVLAWGALGHALDPPEAVMAKGNETAAMAFLSGGSTELLGVAEHISMMKRTLTLDDFLAVPFDLQNADDAKVFDAMTHDKAGFQAWRENTARAMYHMELGDYEALFGKSRTSLLNLAESLNIPVTVHKTSYDSLLRSVDIEVSRRERAAPKGAASFVEARMQVSALRESTYLYEGRPTLHSLIVQDAIMFISGAQIGQALDWVVNQINKFKCTWCKAVLNFIRRSACIAAGNAICKLLCGAMGGPLGLVAGKFFCDFPLYLGKMFGRWCQDGVKFIQDKLRLTEDCLCSFSVPTMTIPATKFTLLKVTLFESAQKVIQIGQICATKPGQCAGSSKEDQAKYDTEKAASDAAKAKAAAEEAERVKKMTLAQKIDYHKKIIAGQIKTNMTDRMVYELLSAVTGLGKSVGKSLVAGAKELAKGNVKGAVVATGAQLAKDVGSSVVKAAAKKAVAITTTAVVSGVAKTAIGAAADGAKQAIGKAAANAGNNVVNSASNVGNRVVNAAAAVISATGNKQTAANFKAAGQKAVNNTANALGNATRTTLNAAGRAVVAVAENAANGMVLNKVARPLGNNLGDRLTGGSNSGSNNGGSSGGSDPAPKPSGSKPIFDPKQLISSMATGTASQKPKTGQ